MGRMGGRKKRNERGEEWNRRWEREGIEEEEKSIEKRRRKEIGGEEDRTGERRRV